MSRLSIDGLVKIPYEYDEDKSSDNKDDLYDLDLSHDSSINLRRSSSSIEDINQIFSPSETYKHNQHFHSSTTRISFDLVRIVSHHECSMLKTNIIRVLKDNNYDLLYEFNVSEFIVIFKKILASSPEDEITKLFNILTPTDSKVISFECILNNESNLNILLEAMGCMMDKNDTNKNELFLPRIGTKYSVNKHREYNINKPILSWRNDNDTNINNGNYMEYIEYQREVIETLRNEINNVYKPIILHNKELEIKTESLLKQVDALQLEKNALENEVQLLEIEVTDIRNDYNDYNEGSTDMELLQRRMSHSYAEIQESHECLESELISLQQNLHRTRKQNNKKNDENYKLQQINDKYGKLNEKLRNNVSRRNKELKGNKMIINDQNEEINRLKYEVFEKEQRIETLSNCVDDLSQHIQFMKSRPHSAHSTNSTYSKRRKRSNSNHLTMEFDIFTDMVLSPNSLHQYQNKMQKEGNIIDENKDQLIHALQNDLNELQMKYEYNTLEVEYNITNNYHKKMSNTYQYDKMSNNYYGKTKKVKKVKNIGTQTKVKVLGFWDQLLSNVQCVPLDQSQF